jgi:hypothetical protein
MNPEQDASGGSIRRGLRNGNPPGDFTMAPRCGAKNRRGMPCRCPAMASGGRSTSARRPKKTSGAAELGELSLEGQRLTVGLSAGLSMPSAGRSFSRRLRPVFDHQGARFRLRFRIRFLSALQNPHRAFVIEQVSGWHQFNARGVRLICQAFKP